MRLVGAFLGFVARSALVVLRVTARMPAHQTLTSQKIGGIGEIGPELNRCHDANRNERQAQVITLRYFGGMTMPEVAIALGISIATVERDWRLARAWLGTQLNQAILCAELDETFL